jgi:hypothetical protein
VTGNHISKKKRSSRNPTEDRAWGRSERLLDTGNWDIGRLTNFREYRLQSGKITKEETLASVLSAHDSSELSALALDVPNDN